MGLVFELLGVLATFGDSISGAKHLKLNDFSSQPSDLV